MPQRLTAFEYALDDFALNWIRVRIIKDRGRVIDFVVQHETTIQGKRTPVVRYDTHHDHAHRDVLFPDGSQIKELLSTDLPLDAALQLAIREISVTGHPIVIDFFEVVHDHRSSTRH